MEKDIIFIVIERPASALACSTGNKIFYVQWGKTASIKRFFFVLVKKTFIVQTGNDIYYIHWRKTSGIKKITYMHAVILHIVGETSPFDKLNDGTTPTWFSRASTSVLLRSLFNLNYCCRRSETIRSAFPAEDFLSKTAWKQITRHSDCRNTIAWSWDLPYG